MQIKTNTFYLKNIEVAMGSKLAFAQGRGLFPHKYMQIHYLHVHRRESFTLQSVLYSIQL